MSQCLMLHSFHWAAHNFHGWLHITRISSRDSYIAGAGSFVKGWAAIMLAGYGMMLLISRTSVRSSDTITTPHTISHDVYVWTCIQRVNRRVTERRFSLNSSWVLHGQRLHLWALSHQMQICTARSAVRMKTELTTRFIQPVQMSPNVHQVA